MRFNYYRSTDSLYIDLVDRPSTESREVANGAVLDYDEAGYLVGIDIDNASLKIALQKLEIYGFPGTVVKEETL